MGNFTFRIRFDVSPLSSLASDLEERELCLSDGPERITLYSGDDENPIHKAESLVLKGFNYASEEAAKAAAVHYQDILMITLARLGIGVDFGYRQGKGRFVDSFLASIEEETGQRILNNVHGLMVYENDPPPRFVFWKPRLRLGCTKERFESIYQHAFANPYRLSDRERIALELFNSSFFVRSADSRLIALVMAIEALIEPQPRNSAAEQHVANLIKITEENTTLSSTDKISYLSTLQWLFNESIAQGGRRLVAERLGERVYNNLPAVKFFTKVYGLRSNLVHGIQPYPSWEEVGNWAASLEDFVGDLIAYTTLEVT